MVPAGNALGVLSRKFHRPPLKISGIQNRCNAVDGTFYDAIKFPIINGGHHAKKTEKNG